MARDKHFRIGEYPVTIALTALILLFFGAFLVKEDTVVSKMENRPLQQRPQITIASLADGSFMDSFDTYTKEQLFLRDGLISLKAACEQAFLKTENNGVIRTSDGALVEKALSTSEQYDKNLDLISQFIDSCDRHVNICFVPNFSEVYKCSLSAGTPVLNEREMASRMTGAVKKLDVTVIDPIDTLYKHNDEYLYYRTDHHWTSRGAYLAYEEIAKSMGFEPIPLEEVKSESVNHKSIESADAVKGYAKRSVNDFYGTLYAKYKGLAIEPDVIDYYEIPIISLEKDGKIVQNDLYDISKAEEYDKYALFLYGNDGRATIKASNAGNGKHLIMLKDSYANCLIPYLTCNYDTIDVLDLRYLKGSVTEILNENEGADVLMLYNYSFLNSDNHFYKLLQ